MLRKVKLYGELADFVGYKELEAVINSTADAIKFLITNFEGLEAHMANRHYQVLVGDEDIDKTEIHNPIGQSNISIVPVIVGAGGDARKFLLGVALIGIAIALPGAAPVFGTGGFTAAGGATTGWAAFSASLANVGLGLTIMGVSEMLFPLPKPPDFSNEEDPRISFSFLVFKIRLGLALPIQ